VHRRAEEINETAKQCVRHRGLKLVFDHAEVVNCDISATANTLKSQDTPNLLSPISNIRAVTLKLYSRAPSSRVEIRLSAAHITTRIRRGAPVMVISWAKAQAMVCIGKAFI
jgi:hypothetical protein